MYVALDLETTGLSFERDEIIEIAAVLFDRNKIHKTYSSLVKPTQGISSLITHITGISDKDVQDAPSIDSIKNEFARFIGNHPIVGHNIQFDISFLKNNGLTFFQDIYDTLPLSSIFFPECPSFSLDILSDVLELDHKEKHRALDDTIASAQLFNKILEQIYEIPVEKLIQIKELAENAKTPLGKLFLNLDNPRQKSKKPINQKNTEVEKEEAGSCTHLKNEDILNIYDKDKEISKIIPGYELREGQKKMTELILKSFEENQHLICEAGTGIGKSFAYLLPAAFLSKAKNEKVVIATYTKNLQDQLFQKDINQINKVFEETLKCKSPINFALLKGRRNYLSGKRLELFKKKSFFEEHEFTLLLKTILFDNETGESNGYQIMQKEWLAWDEINCDPVKCPHNKHEFKQKCFLAKARDRCKKADLIITNQFLLLKDSISDNPILPPSKYCIIDEAHHLDDVATKAFKITHSIQILQKPLVSLITIYEKICKNYNQTLFSNETVISAIERNLEKCNTVIEKINILFGLIGIMLEKETSYQYSSHSLLIDEKHLTTPEWKKIIDSCRNTMILMQKIIKENIDMIYEEHDEISEEERELIEIDNETLKQRVFEMEKSFIDKNEEGENIILWISIYNNNVYTNSVPLHMGKLLDEFLFDKKDSIVMTSATLTVNNSFDYYKNLLGLEHNEKLIEQVIHSPFPYQDLVDVVIEEDLPNPSTPGYFNQAMEVIKNKAIQKKGRTLVLFTSKKAIEGAYLTLAPELKPYGINILAQGISGSKSKILKLFKENCDNTVLFGLNSFWEGVDIQGQTLSTVIIQKLPFDPPNDPLHHSRSRILDDPFHEYQIPRAVLRFKQGFGRLVRSSKDHGEIVILDSRLIHKSYGKLFLDALPMTIHEKAI